MAWLVGNAALISGVLGLLAAFILAWPLVNELSDRKFWDMVSRFSPNKADPAEEKEALKSIRERLLDGRLGKYKKARLFTLGGVTLLAGAFFFLIVDALTRSG